MSGHGYHTNEQKVLRNYMRYRGDLYSTLLPGNVENALVSEANWIVRGHCACGDEIGIQVSPGDICYMDFGQAYLNEMGFQHFGLIINIWQRKALVVPMTSNERTYAKAWDADDNPYGKKNLMRIGQAGGLLKPSVLFLNDMRFVNTARVIDVKAHVDVNSDLFQAVEQRIYAHVFGKTMS